MRRPEERNPRTVDPFGIALAALAMISILVSGMRWTLPISIGFAFIALATQITGRGGRAAKLGADFFSVLGLFLLSVLALIAGASPFAPGGRHPLWSAVIAPGAASIDLDADWVGLLELFGLAFAFLAATSAGAQTQTVRSVLAAIKSGAVFLGLLVGLCRIFPTLIGFPSPLLEDEGLRSALFGSVLLVSVEGLVRNHRGDHGQSQTLLKSVGRRIKSAPLSSAAASVALLCLLLFADAPAVADAIVILALFFAWTVLVGGEQTKLPRRVLLWLTPAVALLAATIAMLVARRFLDTPAAALSRSTHWAAFWASPWLGYGLNTQTDVAHLFMTRLNMAALTADPVPPQAFLVWLEQGGVMVAAPLLAAVGWIAVVIMRSSLAARRAGGLMRAIVCVSLYLGLLGLTSAGPAIFSIEALWAVLLGLGFGAASSSR